MAEIQESGGRRRSPRVDMTAMVDVAFLLLTFFILTTTLAMPEAMEIAKPVADEVNGPIDVKQDRVLSMFLGAEDQVHYFHGMYEGRFETTDFSENGIRKVIQEHLYRKGEPCEKGVEGNCWDPIFVLKPMDNSRYSNLIDALDELRLSGARKYMYTEVTEDDSLWLTDNRLLSYR